VRSNEEGLPSELRDGDSNKSEKLKIYIGFALCGLLLANNVYEAVLGEQETWRIVIGFIPLILAYYFWRRLVAYRAARNG
jgi:hypothetical protein